MSGLTDALVPVVDEWTSPDDWQWVQKMTTSIEAAVLAWLGERLTGAREDVVRAIVAADDAAYVDGLTAATADTAAEVALAAVAEALGIDADHDPREEAARPGPTATSEEER